MATLLDIVGASAPRTVSLRGSETPVYGVSVAGLAALMRRFDDVRSLLTGREVELSADTLFTLGPDVVAALIAAGLGQPGNADYEAAAASLTIEEQLELVESIVAATFPKGPKSFLDRLAGLIGSAESLLSKR